ncbi:MAG: PilN domain-containing protein [Parcubacteria group bacterium]|jgi:Tfp pilus assembly protein PilN
MANINLATNSYAADKKTFSYNAGLMVVGGVLLALVIGYGVILFFDRSAQAKIGTTNEQYETEYQKLISGNKDLVDFQNRIVVAKELVPQESAGYSSLPAVEKAMVPSVYLKDFNYDQAQKTISVGGVADNFDMLAKQILSFKKSDYFTEVSAGATTLDQKGKVNFALKLKIK